VFHVTADSNIFVSAFNFGGNPGHLMDMARHRQIELAVSDPIVNEIARILATKFHWIPEDVANARRRISRFRP
jgi:predicted nucleic acid-binding protein